MPSDLSIPNTQIFPDPVLNKNEGLEKLRNNAAVQDAIATFKREAQEQDQAILGFGKALLDQEFWRRDVLSNADIAARNIVANTAGFASDTVGLLMMARAADPIYGPLILNKLGVESISEVPSAIPGNSEQIAGWLGGDPTHASWLPGAFISPGPGELKGGLALLTGAFRAGSSVEKGIKLAKAADFLRMEKELGMKPMDFRAVAETGWVRKMDGKLAFVIDDSKASIRELDLLEGKNVFRLGDVLDHPELYELYPDAAKIQVTLRAERGEDGVLRLVQKRKEGEPVANFQYLSNGRSKINVFKSRDDMELKGSLLHEVQHFIQEMEGWSTGAGTYGEDFFVKLKDNVLSNRMLKELGEERLKDPKQLGAWLTQNGVDERTWSELSQTARIYGRLGQDAIDNAVGASDFVIQQEFGRAAHVFEYILQKGDASDAEKIDALFKGLSSPEERAVLVALADEAYKFKLGEVEARLADYLKRFDKEAMSKMQDPVETLLRAEDPLAPSDIRLSDDIVIGERAGGNISSQSISPSSTRNWQSDAKTLSKEDAVFLLTDRNSTGYQKELARFVLTGDRFQSLSTTKLFEIADELGLVF